MWELDTKLKQLPVWELATYLGELEAGGPSMSLAHPVDSKPWREEWGNIDEDEGNLYNWMNMLYEEGYKPRPVLTQGTEAAILIVSDLSPPYVKHWVFTTPNSLVL